MYADRNNTVTRVFVMPQVPTGRYELDAMIWPANRIGMEGAETYADTPCGQPFVVA